MVVLVGSIVVDGSSVADSVVVTFVDSSGVEVLTRIIRKVINKTFAGLKYMLQLGSECLLYKTLD